MFCWLNTLKVIENRKVQYPERPLIRISSTFFWHLSSDYDLVPIPQLSTRAREIRDQSLNPAEDDQAIYEPMKVGQQVQK